jgi:hypothetical protein
MFEQFGIRNMSCGSALIESGAGSAFQVNPYPIRIQGVDDKKLKKKIQQKIFF